MATKIIDLTEGMLTVTQPTFHFYLSNVFTWRTGTDLHTLMKAMDKEKLTYWVWYVPGDKDIAYQIRFYQPQVEGAFVLDRIDYQKGKRVVKKGKE
jgi:hypothetical protein